MSLRRRPLRGISGRRHRLHRGANPAEARDRIARSAEPPRPPGVDMAGNDSHDPHGDAVARQAAVEAAGAGWRVAPPTDTTPSHAELRRRLGARPPTGTLAGREAAATAKLAAAGAVAAPARPAAFS